MYKLQQKLRDLLSGHVVVFGVILQVKLQDRFYRLNRQALSIFVKIRVLIQAGCFKNLLHHVGRDRSNFVSKHIVMYE